MNVEVVAAMRCPRGRFVALTEDGCARLAQNDDELLGVTLNDAEPGELVVVSRGPGALKVVAGRDVPPASYVSAVWPGYAAPCGPRSTGWVAPHGGAAGNFIYVRYEGGHALMDDIVKRAKDRGLAVLFGTVTRAIARCSGVPADLLGCAREDAPNYGGWSEGDVLAYLGRFGEADVVHAAGGRTYFVVDRGELFAAEVYPPGTDGTNNWTVELEGYEIVGVTLPDAMEAAVERWRELVAESDPVPPLPPTTRHVMTGDMGSRTEFGTGWGAFGEEQGDG